MRSYRTLGNKNIGIQYITINWKGDYKFTEETVEFLHETKEIIKFISESDTELTEFGIYAIVSGRCRKSSRGVCYIGYTYGEEYERCFIDRLKEHMRTGYIGECEIEAIQPAYFKVGVIIDSGQEKMTRELLEEVEGLLILAHQPDCNVVKKEMAKVRDMIIINRGDYQPLLPRIDSRDFEYE
ncbi:MAG: hypothetical protein ABIL02_03510 [candidate division WOR-3 bacterium]